MKYESAFKPLQGNPAFFWVRASRGPFHLRQKTQSPSHLPISEGRLLLRCLLKVGLHLQSKTGSHSHLQMIWGARNIRQAALLKLMVLDTRDGCLRESLEVPKGSQATFSVWCGSRGGYGVNEREIGLISIWFWLHRAIFHSWGDIIVLLILWQLGTLWSSIKQIESPYVFDWENAISLDTMKGNRASSRREGKVSWVFSICGRNLGYILKLRRGCPFETGFCSVKSGHLSRY